MSKLERRYRKLLSAYPRAHRAIREEEMLGVLLAGSHPGQRWPDVRDALDILRGGLAVRARRVPDSFKGDWREPLAVVSVLAPLMMALGTSLPAMGFLIRWFANRTGPGPMLTLAATLAWPTVLLLSFLGIRRLAVTLAWTVTAFTAILLVQAGQEWWVLELVAALALTFSDGVSHGVRLLGWRRIGLYVLGIVLMGGFFSDRAAEDLSPAWAEKPAQVALILGLLLVSISAFRWNARAQRRASLILSLPLASIAMGFVNMSALGGFMSYRVDVATHTAIPAFAFATFLLLNVRELGERQDRVR